MRITVRRSHQKQQNNLKMNLKHTKRKRSPHNSNKQTSVTLADSRKQLNKKKNTMIALSMYDRLGLYDPSNKYIINYKHKDILQKYQEISKDRPTKTNNLIQLYDIIKNIELRG